MRLEGTVIVISGTPGIGKTSVAKKLASKLNAIYVNLSDVVIEKRLFKEYDYQRGTYVIDEEKVREFVRDLAREVGRLIVVDSHYGEIVDDDLVIKIVVLRLDPRELLRRLSTRSWTQQKIRENVESELLGICTANALSEHPRDKVCEIDVTGKSVDNVVEEVLDILHGSRECRVYIDWLTNDLVVNEVLNHLYSLSS